MNRIIALGCSHTAIDGYINYFNKMYNLEIENFAESAGSNQLQLHKLNNAYIKNKIDNSTILLWQITSPVRNHIIIPDKNSKCSGTPREGLYNWTPIEIELGDHLGCALLANHPDCKITNPYDHVVNLQNIIIGIVQWSYIVKKIIVYFGWEFLSNSEYESSIKILEQRTNITILPKDQSIVSWCRNQNLEFADDFQHPLPQSYIKWGEANLIKYLK